MSWNEFLYQMLAKGEVEQIIVRPDIDIVTIILHEDAIIKGKKVQPPTENPPFNPAKSVFLQADLRTYHMNIADVEKFENKLREAERRLGIKDGVPVTYERGSDSAGKLLISLGFVALLVWFLAKNKGIKTPLNMDVFVSQTNHQTLTKKTVLKYFH